MAYTDTSAKIRASILAEQGASGLVRADYFATRAEGVAATPVGNYFSSTETGTLRVYKRTSTSPFYADQGDAAAPVARSEVKELIRRQYKSTNYYIPDGPNTYTTSASAPGTNVLRGFIGRIMAPVTITTVGVRVVTAATSGKLRAAIYACSDTTWEPIGAPLYTSGDISTATTGSSSAPTNILAFVPGYYWFFTNNDNATAICASLTTSGLSQGTFIGGNSPSSATSVTGYGMTNPGAFGTWPTFTGNTVADGLAIISSSSVPLLAFRAL